MLLPITQSWSYSTNNLDGVAWQAVGYSETGWSNPAPALLYIETAALPAPKNTPLPGRSGGGPMPTYYFRTTFTVSDAAVITSLTFSNLIDDGAIFYLNGVEVRRVGVDNTNISYTSFAGRTVTDATSFDVFSIAGDLLTNLVTGSNVLAAEVHQVNATSSDIVFGAALLAGTNLNLTRGPYLQNASATNLTVRWRTDTNVIGRVRYGTNLAGLDLSAGELTSSSEHEIKLSGLLPDTKYFYSIGTLGTTLAGGDAGHFFVTSPIPGTPKATRIWILGDAGTTTANQVNVRNAYESFAGTRHTDLWLLLGDNAYASGTDAEYQAAMFNIYTNELRNSVVWSTLGNHETYSVNPNGNHAYFDMFTMPRNGEAGGFASGTEHYYSFDYGNIHFICLDSMESSRATNGAMAVWLLNDLANVTADWTIAFWHHPPYTKGSHDSDTEIELVEMRQNFLPLLEAGGVDLVLCGHSHSYERSYLINGHYGPSATFCECCKTDPGDGREAGLGAYTKPAGGPAANKGCVYAVAGSSGQTSGGPLNHPAMIVSTNRLGSLVLDINGSRLDAKFIRENGQITDDFTMLKLNYTAIASNLSVVLPGDSATNLTLAGTNLTGGAVTFLTHTPPARGVLLDFNPVNGSLSYTPAHGFSGVDCFTFRASDGQSNSAPATFLLTVLPPADSNANGLPDDWETTYGISDPNGDADGDGFSNKAEYAANTNPTNFASRLSILNASLNGSGQFTLTWASVGGTRYRVSRSPGFGNGGGGNFTPIIRPVAEEMDPMPIGTPSIRSFTNGIIPGVGAGFYRVQVVR